MTRREAGDIAFAVGLFALLVAGTLAASAVGFWINNPQEQTDGQEATNR
jgi:hypothetical protein